MIPLMLVLVLIPGRSSADEDSLVVVIILESHPIATYGDNIDFRIHVFDRGVPADADDNPELTARSIHHEYRNEARNVTSDRVGVGEYVARIELQDEEIDIWGEVEVKLRNMYDADKKYAVRVGRDSDEDNVYDYIGSSDSNEFSILLDTSRNLEIRSELKDPMTYPWGPGDRIDLSVEVLLNGGRKNADEINWNVDHWEDFDPFIDVTYDNPDTGLYDLYIWIPENLTRDIDFEVEISAVVGDMEALYEVEIPVEIFHLWSHKQPSGLGELNCNLYVSDNEGHPVKGAEIDAHYQSEGIRHLTGVTDAQGKARFVFLAHDSDEIDVSGWITKEGRNQSFWTSVTVIPRSNLDTGGEVEPDDESEYYPWPWGFDVVEVDDEPVEKDGTLKMDYIAFLDGERFGNRAIYYVIYNQYERIYGHGGTITGPDGKFTVEFEKPSTWVSALIDFKCQIGYHRTVWVDLYNWVDSDSDGYSDDYEIWEGTDPRDQFDHPEMGSGRTDSDWDGICDQEENFYGTNPEDRFDSPKFEPGPYDQRWTDHNSTDGYSYGSSLDYILISSQEDLDLQSDKYAIRVRNFKVGGKTEVSLKSDGGNSRDPDHLMLYFTPGGMDDVNRLVETGETPEWTCWTDDQQVTLFYQDGHMTGVVLTPDFLPSGDQEYTFLGGDFYSMNNVVVKDGQSREAGDWGGGDGGSNIIIVIIIVIVIILMLIALGISGYFIGKKVKAEKERKDREKMMEELKPAKSSIVDEIMTSDVYAMTGPPVQQTVPVQAQVEQETVPASVPRTDPYQDQQMAAGLQPIQTEMEPVTPADTEPVQQDREMLPWEIEPSMDFFNAPPVQEAAVEQTPAPPVVEADITPAVETPPPADEIVKEETVQPGQIEVQDQPEIPQPQVEIPPVEESTPEPSPEAQDSRIDDLFD